MKRRAVVAITNQKLIELLGLSEEHRVLGILVDSGDALMEQFRIHIEGPNCPDVPDASYPMQLLTTDLLKPRDPS